MKILYKLVLFSLFVGCALHFTPQVAKSEKKKQTAVLKPQEPDFIVKKNIREQIISVAKKQLGVRYRYGGIDPRGFDCSGFVGYVYKEAAGKKLPRSSLAISRYVKIYQLSKLKKGDLLFFDTSNKGHINHCGIYLGDGKFIHSSSGKAYGVTISNLRGGFYQKRFRFGGKVPGMEKF